MPGRHPGSPKRIEDREAEGKVPGVGIRNPPELTVAGLDYNLPAGIGLGKVVGDDNANLRGGRKVVPAGVSLPDVQRGELELEVDIFTYPLIGGLVYGGLSRWIIGCRSRRTASLR